MIPMKAQLRDLLRASMRGETSGLSPFGRFAKRLADHVEFHARVLEREARFSAPAAEPSNGWGEEDIRGRLVYDFGANHGRNIPYYLARGLNVVAVEANPHLCENMTKIFDAEFKAGRLVVVNSCLVENIASLNVDFYIHNYNDLLSTFIVPEKNIAAQFHRISIPAETPSKIFARYGDPFYVKIDLEGLDADIVRFIGNHEKIPYISAEAHHPDVLVELIAAGYRKFKVVEGAYAHAGYYNIRSSDFEWTFEPHAAGPFGEDIPGRWLSASEVIVYLAANGYGWKDIHAKF